MQLENINKRKNKTISVLMLLFLFVSFYGFVQSANNELRTNTNQNSLQESNYVKNPDNKLNNQITSEKVDSSSYSTRPIDQSQSKIRTTSLSTISSLSSTMTNYQMSTKTSGVWYNAATNGVNLNLNGDDVYANVTLPFYFQFYDTNFTTIYVSSNGWLSFNDTTPDDYSNPLFPTTSYYYAISPFWYDLEIYSTAYYWNTPSYSVIEYVNPVYHTDNSSVGTFEVVLFSNGTIIFLYQNIFSDYGATVGLNYGLNTSFFNNYAGLSGSSNFQITFDPIAPSTYNLVSDFEGSIAGWKSNGLWNLRDTSQSYGLAFSPTHAFWYGDPLVGTYNTGGVNSGWLNSTFIQLGSNVDSLSFETWYSTETGTTYDKKQVYIQDQFGGTYLLTSLDGTQQSWQNVQLDLSIYAGQTVKICFFFNTVDSAVNDYQGWYIDDVGIIGDFSYVPLHDVGVSLDTQTGIQTSKTTFVNATVTNYGNLNETNVYVSLFIAGVNVTSAIIPSLLAYSSYTINYPWTPTASGNYNVTAYVQPIINETMILDNTVSTSVYVGTPVITGSVGDYFTMVFNSSSSYSVIKFTLSQFYGSNMVNITADQTMIDSSGTVTSLQQSWMGINIISRYVESGTLWMQTYFLNWIQTNLNVNDQLNVLTDTAAIITAITSLTWQQITYSVFNVSFQITGVPYYGLYDVNTGLLLYLSGSGMTAWLNESSLITVNPVVVDFTIPTVYSYGDIYYNEGSTGNEIVWYATDSEPNNYTITDNYGYYVTSGFWTSGNPIYLNVDGLTAGNYYYTITVYDVDGNSASNTVYVTVYASIPTVTSNGNVYYTEGSTGNEIVWWAYSSNPDTYSIYDNYGYVVQSGYWYSGSTIYFNVDGLSAGTYYYTITVYDVNGNSASDTVYVYVNTASTSTITIPTTSTSYTATTSYSSSDNSQSSSTSNNNNQSTSRSTISAVSPGFELIFAFMGLIGIYLLRRRI